MTIGEVAELVDAGYLKLTRTLSLQRYGFNGGTDAFF